MFQENLVTPFCFLRSISKHNTNPNRNNAISSNHINPIQKKKKKKNITKRNEINSFFK